ncbi:MAG: thioredoxin domain-containing protein [Myxococcota bacterium]
MGGNKNKSVSLQPKNRSTDAVRNEGNRLKNEKSLYLRQHAHNPLDWYPWGDEALKRAKNEQKPIFLSIGYSSCHWCHVMEKEVFEKDDVAAFMNEHFICIKVDREERPDLDAVYMEALQAMTGSGGWPMSLFLTPDLKPFFGATYIPYPQFLNLAKEVHTAFLENRSKLEIQANAIYEILSKEANPPAPLSFDESIFGDAKNLALSQFDDQYGGFGSAVKFPRAVSWRFLLHLYRKLGDEKLGDAIKKTLDNMASGGIYDHIGGGFHRYATERTWLIPHFEKMLYDNALLASLYTESSVVFGVKRYGEVACDTLDFLMREMRGEEGGFFSSFDADSDGKEGDFYVWKKEELIELSGKVDGEPLALLLGVTQAGNFEGKNIITRRIPVKEVAEKFKRSEKEIAGLFDKLRPELVARRSNRVKPALDKKVITAWNGLAISAFAEGFLAFGEKRYLKVAEEAAEFLWRAHRKNEGGLFRSSYDSAAGNDGILDDYAFFANALLELYKATGKIEWLKRAVELIEYVHANFKSEKALFYIAPKSAESPMGQRVIIADSAEPSGNAVLLNALLALSALTGKDEYLREVERGLSASADLIKKYPFDSAGMADVALKFLSPFYEVVIAGDRESKDTKSLLQTFYSLLPPYAALISVPANGADDETLKIILPASAKRALDGIATGFVCRFGNCDLPTKDPAILRKQLTASWKY